MLEVLKIRSKDALNIRYMDARHPPTIMHKLTSRTLRIHHRPRCGGSTGPQGSTEGRGGEGERE